MDKKKPEAEERAVKAQFVRTRHGADNNGVDSADPEAVASACERLLTDADLASRLGEAGRVFVRREFDLHRNVDRLIDRFAATTASS